MVEFGWDASDYDWSRGAMDLTAAKNDGISFFTHKATEGTTNRHIHYGEALTRARGAGIPVLGAYHVVRSTAPLANQVTAYMAYLDSATPWWRAWPNWLCQVDLERWPYDNVSADIGTQFADLLAATTGKTVVIYASKGQYGNSLKGTRPLWNAAYASSKADHYRALYPGDNGSGWQSYSGRPPVFWQYTSSAKIGTQLTCDANAFRGTLDQLLAFTSTTKSAANGGTFMALDEQQQKDMYDWLAGLMDEQGDPPTRSRFSWRAPKLAVLHDTVDATKAEVEALKAELDIVKATVQSIGSLPIALTDAQLNKIIAALTAAVAVTGDLNVTGTLHVSDSS